MTLATGLALLGILSVPAFVSGTVLLTALPLAVAGVRARVGWPRLGRRRLAAVVMGSAGLAVAVVLTLVPSVLEPDDGILPIGATTWYYGRLAGMTAAQGGFPAGIVEWGRELPFHIDYAPVTAHTAAIVQLLGGDLVLAMGGIRLTVFALVLATATSCSGAGWVPGEGRSPRGCSSGPCSSTPSSFRTSPRPWPWPWPSWPSGYSIGRSSNAAGRRSLRRPWPPA
jgi:hypothetical protein